MLKAIVFGILGAGAMYLYLGHGDIPAFIEMLKGIVNQGAGIVKEATQQMNYKGFRYEQDIQEEEDNRKIFHEVIDPQGQQVRWGLLPDSWHDISPYRSATVEEFEAAVNEVIFYNFIAENG